MKIQKVTFSGFRNVPDLEKEIAGKDIILLADNTAGKSNFMQGIIRTLEATGFGKNAVRKGHKDASIEVVCADYKEWQEIEGTRHKFRARIKKGDDGEEKVTFEVILPNNRVVDKKTAIGAITGELHLDYNFVELSKTLEGKRRQMEYFESILPKKVQADLQIWKNEVDVAVETRKELNKEIKTAEGFIKGSGLSEQDFLDYAAPASIEKILNRRAEAQKINLNRKTVQDRIDLRKTDIKERREQILRLEKEIEDLDEKNRQAAEWLDDLENAESDLSVYDQQIADLTIHNQKHNSVLLLKAKQFELDNMKAKAAELTTSIEKGRQMITDALKDMQYPIKGISFDDENVYYFGKLIDEDNMSTAEIMILEARLKMAKSPGVSSLFISRGESMGTKLLGELRDEAHKQGFHIIMEQVERGEEELRIEYMTDAAEPKKKKK